ncbi:MAG: hypothetical protein WCT77_00210 [Bacteroidota bacterium]|jgi:hypothetical protein
MKNEKIALLVGASLLVGYALSLLQNIGKPRIKLLPFTEHENGLSVLNYEINGIKEYAILSNDGISGSLGTDGNTTWMVDMNSLKNITISAYNKKTKKASAVYTVLPDGMSLVKKY